MGLRRGEALPITPPIPPALDEYRRHRDNHDWASAHGLMLGIMRAIVIIDGTLSSSMAFATLKQIIEEEDERGRA